MPGKNQSIQNEMIRASSGSSASYATTTRSPLSKGEGHNPGFALNTMLALRPMGWKRTIGYYSIAPRTPRTPTTSVTIPGARSACWTNLILAILNHAPTKNIATPPMIRNAAMKRFSAFFGIGMTISSYLGQGHSASA